MLRKRYKRGFTGNLEDKTKEYINHADSAKLFNAPSIDFVSLEDITKEDPLKRRYNDNGTGYVDFILSGNDLINDLYSLYISNAVHKRIIEDLRTLVVGQGFTVYEEKRSLLSNLKKPAKIEQESKLYQLDDYISNDIDGNGNDLNQVLKKIYLDYKLYGNCFIELRNVKLSTGRKTLIKVLEVNMCKPVWVSEQTQKVQQIAYSKDFSSLNSSAGSNVTKFNVFPNFAKVEGKEYESCVYHLKNETSLNFYWGVPDYIAAKLDLSTNYKAKKFNDKEISNNFAASAIVQIIGDFETNDEAKKISKSVVDTFSGQDNAGRIVVNVTNDPEAKVTAEVLDTRREGNYIAITENSRKDIVISHGVTDTFLGILHAGSLGDTKRTKQEFELTKVRTITPAQEVLEKMLSEVLPKAAEYMSGNWANYCLKIQSTMPIIEDLKPELYMTVNEMRLNAGKQPIEGGDIFINQAAAQPQNDGNND